MKCSNCHLVNDADSIFCGRCGQQLDAPTTDSSFHVGAVVADGRYRLDALLGVGGMGTVYKATDLSLKRSCALKLLNPELTSHPTARRRMEQEARILARISHHNVVQVRNIFTDDETLVMELEYVAGGDLSGIIRPGGMEESEARRWMVGILDGLQALHDSGLVHRDVKPDNVLVDGNGIPKVTDLGIARDSTAREKTQLGTVLGTLEYMSPEQIQGIGVDARADIYACGIMLFRMLSGELPFNATSEFEWQEAHVRKAPDFRRLLSRRRISDGLLAVLKKAMAKDPAARFASAKQMKAALTAAAQPVAPQAAKVSAAKTSPRARQAAPGPRPAVVQRPPSPPPPAHIAAGAPVAAAPAPRALTPEQGVRPAPVSTSRLPLIVGVVFLGLLVLGGGVATVVSFSGSDEAETPVAETTGAPTPPQPAIGQKINKNKMFAAQAKPRCKGDKQTAVLGEWRITTNVGGKSRATRGRYNLVLRMNQQCVLTAQIWRDGFTVPSGKWMEYGHYPNPKVVAVTTETILGSSYFSLKARWKKATILFHFRPAAGTSGGKTTRMSGAWMYLTKKHRTFNGPLLARRLEHSGLGSRSTISGYPTLDSWKAVQWTPRTTWVAGGSGGWN